MRRLILCTLAASSLLSAQTAAFTTFGNGCVRQRGSFFQNFSTGTFDLGGTTQNPGGWTMIFIGEGWFVLPPITSWRQPVSPTALSLGDDSVSLAQPLGFTMPIPSGTTSNIWIGSNGFVYLESDTNTGCCNGDPAVMLSGAPRIAGYWMDLLPSATGNITIDRSTEDGGVTWVTYNAVSEYGGSGTVTFQIVFRPFGQIDVLYGACTNSGHTAMSGYSPGRGSLSPGTLDLSALIPSSFVTGRDADPLSLTGTGRPRIGTAMTLVVNNVPDSAPFVWMALGSQSYPTGVDLSGLGMFFCTQYASAENSIGLPRVGSTATWNLSVPNEVGLLGQHAYVQALSVASGVNPVSLLTSNGADLFVGSL